jgi:transposase-like protein
MVSSHAPVGDQQERHQWPASAATIAPARHEHDLLAAREDLYSLGGLVEADDAFFGGVLPQGKRGRGSENKTKVLVAVSFGRHEDDPKYCKFKVVTHLTKAVVTQAMSTMLEAETIVKTDGCRLYNGLSEAGLKHKPLTMKKPEDNQQWLPWVHILISNAKRFILGTHHSVKSLGLYLAEFAWRFNRRRSNLFDRLIHTALCHNPTSLPALSH